MGILNILNGESKEKVSSELSEMFTDLIASTFKETEVKIKVYFDDEYYDQLNEKLIEMLISIVEKYQRSGGINGNGFKDLSFSLSTLLTNIVTNTYKGVKIEVSVDKDKK